MRHLIYAIAPFALAACGAPDPKPVEPPLPAVPPATTAQAETPPPKAPVQVTEAAGTWSRGNNGSGPVVTFASADGARLFSVTCRASGEDTDGPAIELTSLSSGDAAADSIDIFTSAGNAQVAARPDKTPGTVFALTDTLSQAPYVLAAGSGQIKIVSGTKGVSFQTDQMLEDLIESCRPAYAPPAADTTGEEATGADTEETPSGT